MAFMATSQGLSMISAVTCASTPLAGMIVRPENAANAASTSRMFAFSQAIVMRGCCCCELLMIGSEASCIRALAPSVSLSVTKLMEYNEDDTDTVEGVSIL